MAPMIDATRLRGELVRRIDRLHQETRRASGFDALITAGAMMALAEMLHSIDAAVASGGETKR